MLDRASVDDESQVALDLDYAMEMLWDPFFQPPQSRGPPDMAVIAAFFRGQAITGEEHLKMLASFVRTHNVTRSDTSKERTALAKQVEQKLKAKWPAYKIAKHFK